MYYFYYLARDLPPLPFYCNDIAFVFLISNSVKKWTKMSEWSDYSREDGGEGSECWVEKVFFFFLEGRGRFHL